MTNRHRWPLGLIMLAALSSSGCPADPEVERYLIVAPAAEQPGSPALGTSVLVQQRGGAYLRLKTIAGKLDLSTDAPGGAAQQPSCIPAPPPGEPRFFLVIPDDVECELYVDLLGPGSGDDAPACSGPLLASRLLPITNVRQSPSGDGGGGAGGAGEGGGGTGGTGEGGGGTGGDGGDGGSTGGDEP
ncbi:hypothetical protein [Sorangium sp. So ce385]|uniref:hypothetical protein n=1 Tax=Sorangium sp. So ce385 TaxID=3133308 RepID=UPI003F5B4E6E